MKDRLPCPSLSAYALPPVPDRGLSPSCDLHECAVMLPSSCTTYLIAQAVSACWLAYFLEPPSAETLLPAPRKRSALNHPLRTAHCTSTTTHRPPHTARPPPHTAYVEVPPRRHAFEWRTAATSGIIIISPLTAGARAVDQASSVLIAPRSLMR